MDAMFGDTPDAVCASVDRRGKPVGTCAGGDVPGCAVRVVTCWEVRVGKCQARMLVCVLLVQE